MFRVSVLGVIHVLKAALPAMIEQGGGTIINIEAAANAGASPVPTIMNATRHAIESLSQGLRREFSQKPGDFHVIDIAPASVNASLFHQARTMLGTQLVPARRSTTPGSLLSRSSLPPRTLSRRHHGW